VPLVADAPVNGANGHHVLETAYAPDVIGRSTLARRWPILVAIAAGIAIVVCAYLLLFAPDRKSASAKPVRRDDMPAPDRMDTHPQAPTPPTTTNPNALPDPWGGTGSGGSQGTAPQLPPDFDDPPDPGAVPPPAPNPAPDPQAGGSASAGAPPAEEFLSTLQDKACQKLTQCGLGGQMGQAVCQLFGDPSLADQQREMVRSGRCTYDEAKAASCMKMLDGIQCKAGAFDLDQLGPLVMNIGDCAEALHCQ
jgi:hypothetical protein